MTVVVPLVLALGMVVVVPLGLGLIAAPGLAAVRRWWAAGAVPGALALALPRGWAAAALTLPYLAVAGAAAVTGLRRTARLPRSSTEVAVLAALVAPAAGAAVGVAERAGAALLGFDLQTLALTPPHFHYAGSAAALLAGLGARVGSDRSGRLATLAVPAGTAVVAVGYLLGQAVELAGTVVLAVGMAAVAWLTWRRARAAEDRAARALLTVSAAVPLATMLLALAWALGEAVGTPAPSLPTMALTHGIANALGFSLCGVLGWHRLKEAPL